MQITNDGRQIRGAGLRTAVFLQGRPQILIEDFHFKLVRILEVAKLELEVLLLCRGVLNRLTLNLGFYSKFSKIWDSFEIKDKTLNIASASKIKNFSWLLFITAKTKIFNIQKFREDVTETALLLHAVLK